MQAGLCDSPLIDRGDMDMIDRIVQWAAWQQIDITECKRMCDLWASDPAYWSGKDMWRLYDAANSRA